MPWALRESGKNRKPSTDELQDGLRRLEGVLGLLPSLQVMVLCGEKAQRATEFLYMEHPELCVLHAPHPATQSMNQPGKREHLRAAIEKAARLV